MKKIRGKERREARGIGKEEEGKGRRVIGKEGRDEE